MDYFREYGKFAVGGALVGYLVNQFARSYVKSSVYSVSLSGMSVSSDRVELPLSNRPESVHMPSLSANNLTSKQTLNDLGDIRGKRILMRTDYNVKIKNGAVVDSTRITTTIPTLKHLLSQSPASIAIITHLGRPAGNFNVKEFSTEPVVAVLRQHLPGVNVQFLPNCIGASVEAAIAAGPAGTVFLCENLRFHPEETGMKVTKNADGKVERYKSTWNEKVAFRAALSRLGDVFVFEAFGAAHRPHSSIIGIDLPQRVAGLLMGKELSYYGNVLTSPRRPFLAIVGGAKVSDKILVLENLISMVDELIIGGGMAYTFLKVLQQMSIGGSLFDSPGAAIVTKIMEKAKQRGVKIHLPVDHIIGDRFAADAKVGVTTNEIGIPAGWMGLDVGPRTRVLNSEVIGRATTILWNGPLGVYELNSFSGGTLTAMHDLSEATRRGATTIIGGGDTGSASNHFHIGKQLASDCMSHVSTGGGSSLVLMEGKLLWAVVGLSNKGDNSRPPAPDESKEPPVGDDDD